MIVYLFDVDQGREVSTADLPERPMRGDTIQEGDRHFSVARVAWVCDDHRVAVCVAIGTMREFKKSEVIE